MDEQGALKPAYFSNLPTFIKEQQAKAKGVTPEEEHYNALSKHTGYKQLKAYANSLMEDLERVTDSAMSQGLTWEEIGRNAVVANLAKGLVKRIFERVDDAVEACERKDGVK